MPTRGPQTEQSSDANGSKSKQPSPTQAATSIETTKAGKARTSSKPIKFSDAKGANQAKRAKQANDGQCGKTHRHIGTEQRKATRGPGVARGWPGDSWGGGQGVARHISFPPLVFRQAQPKCNVGSGCHRGSTKNLPRGPKQNERKRGPKLGKRSPASIKK